MKCCDLTAGMLRHIVDVQRESGAEDSAGGAAQEWETFIPRMRCRLQPVSGRERFQADRLEMNITHRMHCRYRSDIGTQHSVLYDGRRMQVRYIIDLEERKQWLEIGLEEGAAT